MLTKYAFELSFQNIIPDTVDELILGGVVIVGAGVVVASLLLPKFIMKILLTKEAPKVAKKISSSGTPSCPPSSCLLTPGLGHDTGQTTRPLLNTNLQHSPVALARQNMGAKHIC